MSCTLPLCTRLVANMTTKRIDYVNSRVLGLNYLVSFKAQLIYIIRKQIRIQEAYTFPSLTSGSAKMEEVEYALPVNPNNSWPMIQN